MSFFKKRVNAFSYAFKGVIAAFWTESAMKVHFIACFLVAIAAWLMKTTAVENCILILCCCLVIGAELVNTAIERLCDRISTEQDEDIGFVKDVSAGAVLVFSIGSLFVACIVFGKHFI